MQPLDQSAMEVVGALIMGSPGPTAEVLGFYCPFLRLPVIHKDSNMSLMLSHGCGNGFPIETGMNWCVYIYHYISPMFRQTQFQQVPSCVSLVWTSPLKIVTLTSNRHKS
jgi:hypothetical protein